MNFDEIEELLQEERTKLEEKINKMEEAVWFIERLRSEDYNTPEERVNVEEDLKAILSELNMSM